ncbi:Rha family transcriptional regulator [Xenophilus azovorans]|uniref:Rha family transcriptional regulator n=1 Tax=Xenophilus azovorans TaxID=151755 RepID=UPI000AABCA9B|nr:Rha family transcriptional regulator [Xenophilus azovorans]
MTVSTADTIGTQHAPEDQHALAVLVYNGRPVRAICIEGAIWVAAADAAHVLGIGGGEQMVRAICGSSARYHPSYAALGRIRILDGAELALLIGKARCGDFLAREFGAWLFREAQPILQRMIAHQGQQAANDAHALPARVEVQPTPMPGNHVVPLATPAAGDTAPTMTSLEIAELVESRHDSVKRTIERLANQGVIAFPPLVEKPSTGGRPGSEFVFEGDKGKRDSIIVVAQLSPEFTARLVDRWQELESGAAAAPRVLSEAERLLLQAQALLKLERENSELREGQERLRATAAEQAEALVRVADDVKMIADSKVHDAPPAGMETVSAIRRRMREKYGLGADVVGWVIREADDFRLPVVGQVRNRAEDERAPATCALYQVRSATLAVEHFLRGAKLVPGTQRDYMHPAYPHRFRLAVGGHLRAIK